MDKTDLIKEIDLMMVHLYDASIEQAMGGLGGCKHYEARAFPARFRNYIDRYVNDEDYTSVHAVVDYLIHNGYLRVSGF